MIDLQAIALGTLIVVAATVIATLAARPWRAEATRLAGLPAVGLVAGFLGAIFVVVPDDVSMFPPRLPWQWMLWGLLPLLLIGVMEAVLGPRTLLRWIIGLMLAILAIGIMGIGRLKHPRSWTWHSNGWSGADWAGWVGLAAAVAILIVISCAVISRKVHGRVSLSAWLVCTGLLGLAIATLGVFTSISYPAGMLAVGVSALLLLQLIFPKFEYGLSVWLAITVLYVGMLSMSTDPWYGRMPIAPAMLLLIAPLGMWAALLADRTRWWPAMIIVMIAVLAIAGWPAGSAIKEYIEYREQGLAF